MKLSDIPVRSDTPFRFKVSLSPTFGRLEKPNIPDSSVGSPASPFYETEVDIHELIRHQSAGFVEGAPCGGAIAHSSFRGNYRAKGNVLRCQLAVIDIDAKGWDVETIRAHFPSAQQFVAKSELGQYIAAILPSKSLATELTDTCVGHLLIPFERSLGSIYHIAAVLDAITQSVVATFPNLNPDVAYEKTGNKGGIDTKAGENLAGLWYGMRADQQPMYVNPAAYLPSSWIDAAISSAPKPDINAARGGVVRLRRHPRQRFGSHTADIGYCPDTINITEQVLKELAWLFENILEPPGVGTYNEWFCDIKQFCSTHRPHFDDLFFDLVDRDTTGHRVKDQSAQQQLDAAGFTSMPSWKPLVRALNYNDEDWLGKFYEAHGYHSCISYTAPGQDVYRIPFQRYQLMLLTQTHHLRCVIPEDE